MTIRAEDRILHRVYEAMPVFLQNLAFSLVGSRDRHERYGGDFSRVLAGLKESQWARAEEIRAFQDRHVADIVQHAYKTVPLYRRLYDEHGVRPQDIRGVADLPRLPLVTKEMIRTAGSEAVSTQYKMKALSIVLTSGTTGTPLRVYRLRESLRLQWAIWWRHRARFGASIDDSFLMVGARIPISAIHERPPFWRQDWANHRTYLGSYHLRPACMLPIVRMLQERRFKFYLGYPSAIAQLCEYLLENNITLKNGPKVVFTASDALLPQFQETIQQALGVPVTDQYGMAEFAGNYSRCEHGTYHLDYECCCAELLPIEGSDRKSIVLTGWGNRAMPMIRYATGDHAFTRTPMDGPCACGRESMQVYAIDGRLEDYIYTPDGRKLMGMNQVFEYGVGVREMQIVQDRLNHLEIRIVRSEGYDDAATKSALTRELVNRIGNQDMQFTFEFVDHIPREPNGKFRAVKSHVTDDSHAGRVVRDALEV